MERPQGSISNGIERIERRGLKALEVPVERIERRGLKDPEASVEEIVQRGLKDPEVMKRPPSATPK